MKTAMKQKNDGITVINLLSQFKFPHIAAKNSLRRVFGHFHYKVESVNIVFMGDSDITHINVQYLSHNYSTDVISFRLNEGKNVEAELYIGVEEVRRNSLYFETGFYEEIQRVIIHGALHLIGFEDETDEKRSKMREWENYFLKAFSK
jgi:probable rRNA maturation factor